ncbi:MAG: ATP-binding protein [Candidatus Rokuibacteriota bacterium]
MKTEGREKMACVAVRDSGTGLPASGRERLFEPFYTTKADGMGMGLPIARSIAETHGGQFGADDNEGPGATFFFTVPAAVVRDRDAPKTGAGR